MFVALIVFVAIAVAAMVASVRADDSARSEIRPDEAATGAHTAHRVYNRSYGQDFVSTARRDAVTTLHSRAHLVR